MNVLKTLGLTVAAGLACAGPSLTQDQMNSPSSSTIVEHTTQYYAPHGPQQNGSASDATPDVHVHAGGDDLDASDKAAGVRIHHAGKAMTTMKAVVRKGADMTVADIGKAVKALHIDGRTFDEAFAKARAELADAHLDQAVEQRANDALDQARADLDAAQEKMNNIK